MKISLLMDSFPMDFLDLFKQELARFNLPAEVNILGKDVVVTATLEDVVQLQVLVIECDKFRFGGEKDDNLSQSG